MLGTLDTSYYVSSIISQVMEDHTYILARRGTEFLQSDLPILPGRYFPQQQIPLVWLGGAGVLQLELQRPPEQRPHVEVRKTSGSPADCTDWPPCQEPSVCGVSDGSLLQYSKRGRGRKRAGSQWLVCPHPGTESGTMVILLIRSVLRTLSTRRCTWPCGSGSSS